MSADGYESTVLPTRLATVIKGILSSLVLASVLLKTLASTKTNKSHLTS